MGNTIHHFHYRFTLENGDIFEHSIALSKHDIISHIDVPKTIPDWALLENHQCTNCTLKDSRYCPVAVRLIKPIETFHHLKSHDKAEVSVMSEHRTYFKNTDVQDGLRSLFGLIMATSGCPTMEPFRPMAVYHLPFASINETIYRFVTMYLLKRYVENPDQSNIAVDMDDMERSYAAVAEVNLGIKSRLLQCVENDCTLNALVSLDATAAMLSMRLEKTLQEMGLLPS